MIENEAPKGDRKGDRNVPEMRESMEAKADAGIEQMVADLKVMTGLPLCLQIDDDGDRCVSAAVVEIGHPDGPREALVEISPWMNTRALIVFLTGFKSGWECHGKLATGASLGRLRDTLNQMFDGLNGIGE